jgi:hypothetical protein
VPSQIRKSTLSTNGEEESEGSIDWLTAIVHQFIYLLIYFWVLGSKSRTSNTLGKCSLPLSCTSIIYLFIYFGGIGVWTQGFALAKLAL